MSEVKLEVPARECHILGGLVRHFALTIRTYAVKDRWLL